MSFQLAHPRGRTYEYGIAFDSSYGWWTEAWRQITTELAPNVVSPEQESGGGHNQGTAIRAGQARQFGRAIQEAIEENRLNRHVEDWRTLAGFCSEGAFRIY